MSQADVETIRGLIEAFNRDDVEAVLAAFDPSCELHEPPEMPDRPPGGFLGHEGIREWMTNLRATGAVHFEPLLVESSGDIVYSEWSASGQGQASGAGFEWITYVVAQMHDGKVIRAQAFLGEEEALAAAGISR